MDLEMRVFDLETTGLRPDRDSIVELGIVDLDDAGGQVPRIGALMRVPCFDRGGNALDLGTRFHGIGWADIADSPTLAEYAPRIMELLDGAIWIGHNMRRFDAPFLIGAMRRVGYRIRPSWIIDTLEQDRMMRPDRGGVRTPHNLRSACEAWGLDWIGQQHRATDDSIMTAELAIRQSVIFGWGGK